MPTSNSSPVKRPGLGRRAVSSHAVVTRSTQQQNELANSHSSHQKLPLRPHRPHVVGGHRNHHRNPSHGKNLAKFQRHTSHTSVHHLPETTTTTGRYHQRKKSAPATPAASPRGQHHVRWDGAVDSHPTTASMKKNNSSPALRRTNSGGVVGKKALVTSRPNSSSGKKKTVGFELADSDNDDGDWEDTTQSPESTRRSSVAQSKESVENAAVLVDPLTFVKRPYPQFPRATSLPESTSKSFGEGHSPDEDDNDNDDDDDDEDSDNKTTRPSQDTEEQEDAAGRTLDHADIANRLLSPSHSAKAPPAMSSISATVKPAAVDSISRNASLTNIATGPDGLRRPLSSSNPPMANTPGTPAQATSSSIEGGVSRFIKTGFHASVRTDSDPNTPSSFLPHYHPQTPPSPNRASSSRRSRASPPTRAPGTEPPSRTQQKLWLQRTAALNTSPPDAHGVSTAVSPSTMDPNYMATRQGAGPFDPGRGLVNGSTRSGNAVHDNETKHIRKAYEKTSLELTVVRRFQSPTGDSFRRLNFILNDINGPTLGHQRHSSLGKPIKSAPALTHLQDGKQQKLGQNSPSPEPRQLMGRRQAPIRTSVSQTYLQDPEELVNDTTEAGQPAKPLQHPSQRILSTSDEAAHNTPAGEEGPEDAAPPPYFSNETEMMIRRMWESREVAESG